VHPYQDLADAGFGTVQLGQLEYLRAAEDVLADRTHRGCHAARVSHPAYAVQAIGSRLTPRWKFERR
jgi:hypothetical protein